MFFRKPRVDRAVLELEERHEQAKHDRAMLAALLTSPVTYPRHWLLMESFRLSLEIRSLSIHMRAKRSIHPSLRAHYEALCEVGVDAVFRAINDEAVVDADVFTAEMNDIGRAYDELDSLNEQAWLQEEATVDVRGQLELLMKDAHRTLNV